MKWDTILLSLDKAIIDYAKACFSISAVDIVTVHHCATRPAALDRNMLIYKLKITINQK